MKKTRIGIDFDNTIANYEGVFHKLAFQEGIIPENVKPTKDGVRDYLREKGLEELWTKLQGCVYGTKMHEASPFPGVLQFFQEEPLGDICIVSHKTRYPYLGPRYDLHKSARDWIMSQAFFREKVSLFFEETLTNKLARIKSTKCSHFIDDLPEVLTHELFPDHVQRILFDPNGHYPPSSKYLHMVSWKEILNYFRSYVTESRISTTF